MAEEAELRAQVAELKIQRRQIKSALTRVGTFLDKHEACPQPGQLKARYDKLLCTMDEFNRIQDKLELLDEAEFHITEREEFEDKYFDFIARFNKTMAMPEVQHTDRGDASTDIVKLPRIELPKFSGAYDEWLSFYDTFNSLIHSNNSVPAVQKFHYLKACLKGEAANILHSLEISADNYGTAWKMLSERYSNHRIIIQKHINAIFELPIATKENAIILRQILDGALKHIRALTALKRPTNHWDDLLVVIITKKLDSQTLKDWETKIESTEIPTLKELIDFLTQKCQTLETISKTAKMQAKEFTKPHRQNATTNVVTNKVSSKLSCTYCKMDNHIIFDCKRFLAFEIPKRVSEAQAKRLCLNCLRSNHSTRQCTTKWNCKICHKRHHHLLHIGNKSNSTSTSPSSSAATASHSCNINNSIILLSTALIDIMDKSGRKRKCRVLLDCGSQSNLITSKMANYLGLKQNQINISLTGITQAKTHITHAVDVSINSRCTAFKADIHCLILDKISECLPPISIAQQEVDIPKNIKLADPQFHISKEVDMLLGVEVFYKLLCIGQINIAANRLCLQKTLLGWVVSGRIPTPQISTNISMCNSSTLKALNKNICKFWEVETLPNRATYSHEEKYCEKYFHNTVQRDNEGRFVVALPFKDNINCLGESHDQALKRLYSLERKLSKNSKLKEEYISFMKEYLDLGHMRRVSQPDNNKAHFYLPHHAVFKESSRTTKVRVVFDGSASTTSGLSLNDTLLVGPKLQQDLFDIVCRFRTHKYVLTADIAKMYRQVRIHEECMPYQRILWRESNEDAVQTFELTTVTYGTASASYLAIKALQQTAIDVKSTQPFGAQIILRDFYVDDLLTGTNCKTEAQRIITEVTDVLGNAKFELRKWASNDPDLLKHIPTSCSGSTVLDLDKGEGVNTLGLQWNTSADTLQYSLTPMPKVKTITKRQVLSHISKIFDPLGLVSPFTVRAKILMQEIWKLQLDWDESLPLSIQAIWSSYTQEINELNDVKIPRNIVSIKQPKHFELHGFCDASEKGYGACIYIRATNTNGNISCNLLCAKSRIAPLKPVTIPRLELCGALLLAQLASKLTQCLSINFSKIYYWTDSSIVLSWIQSPKAFKTFVANRIAEIQDLTNSSDWHHINTKENPADLVSRGSTPSTLIQTGLWWHGPEFLKLPLNSWPKSERTEIDELPEVKSMAVNICNEDIFDIFERYSSLDKLKRVVAYCMRFKNNIQARLKQTTVKIETGYLTSTELNQALTSLLILAQKTGFRKEYRQLKNKSNLDANSNLQCLVPFMDEQGLMRVGGRLRHSNIPYSQKHQILLPARHALTKLIILNEHNKQLHGGTQQTMAAIRQRYWPLSLKNSVKGVIRTCITCFKAKPTNIEHIMGDLPAQRVTSAKAFENVGIDYFGPIYIRDSMKRKHSLVKAYGAIFVCFATKAVHIELVGNLSTEAFLAALKRFVARRGKISNIYSDNGTQFTGANVELKKLIKQLKAQMESEGFKAYMADNDIRWHFIPPRSPHFGGLWEAAVKSVKLHLTRVVGKASLNYEEMYTLLVQIEGILNSRPITPISNDPNDLTFLTPSHFLTGDHVSSISEPDLSHLKTNTLSRWQHIQFIRGHFWKRWQREYLDQLQRRNKWKSNRNNGLSPGGLVIIREDNIAPSYWTMGRIIEVFPGSDGVVRTASVQTAKGIMQRPATKLCPLPLD